MTIQEKAKQQVVARRVQEGLARMAALPPQFEWAGVKPGEIAPPTPEPFPRMLSARGASIRSARPSAWLPLHERSLQPVEDQAAELEFIAHLVDGQPKGCGCHDDWAKYLKDNPPTIGSVEEYFAWGVEAHNWVNLKLGKPIIEIDRAMQIY